MSEPKPILLRPSFDLAEAMTRAADAAGMSRQAWMLHVLTVAVGFHLHHGAGPDDVPLFVDVHDHVFALSGECTFVDCDATYEWPTP